MKYEFLIPAAFGVYKAFTSKSQKEQLIYGGVSAISMMLFFQPRLNEDREFQDTPGGSSGGAHVDGMVNRLRNVLTEWMMDASSRCDAYEQFYKMSDSDFIAVANKYKRLYKNTIRSSMAETFQSGCGNDIFWWNVYYENWDQKVLEKMNRLNIA